jgi:putative Mn2+ efflux pump MntP
MDATAVAAARGLAARAIRGRDVLLVALLFGGFQAAMPVAGWALGATLGPWIARWDHWIAFGLLVVLGGRMLVEATRGGDEAAGAAGDPFALRTLLVLAVATSIDAFAVGITLPLLDAPFVRSVVTIGVVTALLSAAGVLLGRRFGAHLGRRADALGGVVLIVLGVEILVSHLLG